MDSYGYTDSEIYMSAKLKADGYLTLNDMNKYIREHINVKKKIYYKRNERITLEEFLADNNEKAIICVLGHYIFVNKQTYYSYFDNISDEVVCVWILK